MSILIYAESADGKFKKEVKDFADHFERQCSC